jgi:hypothetical protein
MGKLIIKSPRSVEWGADDGGTISIECEIGSVSDGYHSFDELYDHRCLLFLAVQDLWCDTPGCDDNRCAWKSRWHHDDTGFEGWFIAGLTLPQGQISYHIPEKFWDHCRARELERAPEWDGHTSQDVLERLRLFLA